jgi:CheY-like chemotaxis protein
MSKTILIIEDERALREALKHTLLEAGYSVLESSNGEDGLATALAQHPDLILLDIVMPKLDGLEVTTALRKDDWGKDVKIILLTNLDDIGRVQKAMENEVFTYLIKSNSPLQSVVEKIQEVLGA